MRKMAMIPCNDFFLNQLLVFGFVCKLITRIEKLISLQKKFRIKHCRFDSIN